MAISVNHLHPHPRHQRAGFEAPVNPVVLTRVQKIRRSLKIYCIWLAHHAGAVSGVPVGADGTGILIRATRPSS